MSCASHGADGDELAPKSGIPCPKQKGALSSAPSPKTGMTKVSGSEARIRLSLRTPGLFRRMEGSRSTPKHGGEPVTSSL